jgi:uncharacterized membrane protein
METAKVNVHQVERLASTLLGGALLTQSFKRGLLGGALIAIAGGDLLYRGISGHSFLYQALGISTANSGTIDHQPEVERSITIEKPANELYRFWREPQNLSQIMGNFAQVTEMSDNQMHWLVRGPFGRNMEWDTRMVEERPGEFLHWKSLEGTSVYNEGSLTFRPAPRDWGTEVILHLRFDPPGGVLDNLAAQRGGIVSRVVVEKALRRFKSLTETGEIPTLEHNPSARVSTTTKERGYQ